MKKLFLSLLSFFFFSTASAQTRMALNWKAEPQFGGFYQALLSREVSFEIMEGGSGTPTIQMLSFKKVDFAIVSAEEILISNEKNPKNPVVGVFAVFQTNPQVWITKKDRRLNSISEIMNNPGTIAAQSGLTYVQFLKKKYPHSKVKWVPYVGGISSLIHEKNYTQQGFITSEPLLAEKQGIPVSTFLIADEGFNPYTTVVAVRKSDLDNPLKKSEIKKLVQVFKKGWQDYLKNPELTNQKMATLNKTLDLATFNKSATIQMPLIQPQNLDFQNIGSMSETRWQNLIQTLVDLKILKNPLVAKDQYFIFE